MAACAGGRQRYDDEQHGEAKRQDGETERVQRVREVSYVLCYLVAVLVDRFLIRAENELVVLFGCEVEFEKQSRGITADRRSEARRRVRRHREENGDENARRRDHTRRPNAGPDLSDALFGSDRHDRENRPEGQRDELEDVRRLLIDSIEPSLLRIECSFCPADGIAFD